MPSYTLHNGTNRQVQLTFNWAGGQVPEGGVTSLQFIPGGTWPPDGPFSLKDGLQVDVQTNSGHWTPNTGTGLGGTALIMGSALGSAPSGDYRIEG